MKENTDLEEQIENMQAQLSEMQKKLTMQQGVGVEKNQDGNLGASQEETGEVDYEKQSKMAKKKMLISKMISQG